MTLAVTEILEFLSRQDIAYQYMGRPDFTCTDFCSLSNLKHNAITWIKSYSFTALQQLDPEMELLIVAQTAPENRKGPGEGFAHNMLYVEKPKAAFFAILKCFFLERQVAGVASTAVIESEKIGRRLSVGHFCHIGPDVTIGDDVTIGSHVTIVADTRIGNHVSIASGTIIGSDGQGYYENQHGMVENALHFGGVQIGPHVTIGASCVINRGTLDDTVIEEDVHIGDLCYVAHNAHIEPHTCVISSARIYGSAYIQTHAYIGPGATVLNQMVVEAGGYVGADALVNKTVPAGKVVSGVPARVICDRSLIEETLK